MTVTEGTGAREFRVDFAGALPGAPFDGPGELVLETLAPDDRPHKVTARFFVAGADLRLRLPAVLKGTPWEPRGLSLVNAAAEGGRLVVSFEAGAELVAKLTGGLSSLQALQGYLLEAPNLFDFQGYAIESVAVEVVK